MADVFISYASEDRSTAAALAVALESAGLSVWWDNSLKAGNDWEPVIERQLYGSGCVVVLWSRAAEKSRWVRNEARRAFDAEKVVPVQLDDLALPLSLDGIQGSALAEWDRSAGDPMLQDLLDCVQEYLLRRTEMIAIAPCPLFRCVAIDDWGCAAGGQDGVVRVWALDDKRLLYELVGHGDLATAVAWNGSGLLASGSADRTGRVWSIEDAAVPLQVLRGHGGPIDGVAFAGDSVVTVSADHTTRWWSTSSGEPERSERLDQPLLSCASDSTGRTVAVGGTGGDVYLFVDGLAELSIPGAHQGAVFAIGLSDDGRQLLTTGADGVARLWDTTSGALLHTIRGHRGPVLAGALRDGVIATGSSDGTVRLWDCETGIQLAQYGGFVGGAPGVDLTENGTLIATSAGGHVRSTTVPRPVAPSDANREVQTWPN